MVLVSFTLIVNVALLVHSVDENAFISTLSSEDFVLPAKVLGFRLRTLHPNIAYVVLATEDISEQSVQSLHAHSIDVRRVNKIDTPYIETHPQAKFQYTKIRLWSLTSFSHLVHLDLDTLPLRRIDSLFRCGTFCASLRHSDMFNSGVFALKPDQKIYEDMLAHSSLTNFSSYDGGDQGFLNSFFSKLKFSPMFDENNTEPAPSHSQLLSAAFNYDVAMYYINDGRALIEPAIIHYTMGPTKPWLWWTYPLLDLNSHWLAARRAMEVKYGEPNPDTALPWHFALAAAILCLVYNLLQVYISSRMSAVTNPCGSISLSLWLPSSLPSLLFPPLLLAISAIAAYHSVPAQTHPVTAWTHFTACFLLSMVFTHSLYASLCMQRPFSVSSAARFCALSLLVVLFNGFVLVALPSVMPRLIFCLFSLPISCLVICFLASRMLIGEQSIVSRKYTLLPNKI